MHSFAPPRRQGETDIFANLMNTLVRSHMMHFRHIYDSMLYVVSSYTKLDFSSFSPGKGGSDLKNHAARSDRANEWVCLTSYRGARQQIWLEKLVA